jgi:hypothetical protein
MTHPNQETLALHAGGDLGLWARWNTQRHLSKCGLCRDEVAAFAGVCEILPELAEIPEVPWNRLAAVMRANIRLGLAAGECVRAAGDGLQGDERRLRDAPLRQSLLFTGARAALAFASIVVIVATGLMLTRPSPVAGKEAPLVQATENGIQIRAGGQAFRLMNVGAKAVTYSASADGSMGARYVDPETGYVTINNVYVQ